MSREVTAGASPLCPMCCKQDFACDAIRPAFDEESSKIYSRWDKSSVDLPATVIVTSSANAILS